MSIDYLSEDKILSFVPDHSSDLNCITSDINSGKTVKRENILTDSPLGDFYGYSRAVRKGPFVHVSGTMAANDKGERQGNDGYSETKYILAKIETCLHEAGATIEDVVQTRIFLTDISEAEGVAKAHGETFGSIKPASTLVEVKSLIAPGYLVEIEADAVVDE